MRAFLAVDLDEALLHEVSQVQKNISQANARIKFVENENLHFTCKFFGEITDTQADKIGAIITEKILNHHNFNINIKGTGVFPHLGYIRVIWLGLSNSEPFSQLLMDFDEEFIKLGFKKERSYTPHLTIGRVKGAQNKEALINIIKELEDVEIGTMQVAKISLKKSELTPQGPIYTTLKEFELK
jgi:RNA 2',3'-cyclic 3'-phosphodiesterase